VENTIRIALGPGERSYVCSDSVVEMPQWVAAQTKYRFEKKVAQQLMGKGIEVFVPLLRERHSWSDRQKVVTIPLFSGYAFVHLDGSLKMRSEVLQTAGFMGFVNFRGTAAAISPKQIEDLRLLLQQEVPFSLYPFAQAGRRVRVVGGCLNGVEGVLSHCNRNKLVLSIDSVQRSLEVEIQGYELELI
jgi:transcription antitermination factor NusG